MPLLAVAPAKADPGRCSVIDGAGRCLVEAADPARSGGPQDRRNPRRDSDRGGQRAAAPASPGPPAPIEPVEYDYTPVVGPGGRAGVRPQQLPEIDLPPNGEPNDAVAPVDPAVLAQRSVELLMLQPPAPQISAAEVAYVGVPVWLWIEERADATGPTSATATAGASVVTATGRLVAVEWEMGPPGAVVRCTGTGTPWTGQAGPSPDCGYVYEQRSLPERTGGTGRWPITVTSVWQVTWTGSSGGAPVAGEQLIRLSSESALTVGEVQVLVSGGGDR